MVHGGKIGRTVDANLLRRLADEWSGSVRLAFKQELITSAPRGTPLPATLAW